MIEVFTKAASLPRVWDEIFADNGYLSRYHIGILEKCNPCDQKYILINNRSAFIVYKLKLNIFSYAKLNLQLGVSMIGIPCSVSKPGYKIQEQDALALEGYIKDQKKSCVILNAEEPMTSNVLIQGETLPTCKLSIQWESFEGFMQSLRSHYRYRLNKALRKGAQLVVKKLEDNSLFDEKLYSLYENVFERSQYKLEKLNMDFFKEMPTSIYVFYIEEEPAAFVQLSAQDKELLFVFGGLDYELNHQYDLYMNMLLFILRHGIENKYLSIDMGQTAEDAKLKLGCSQAKRYMYIYHPNAAIRLLISMFVKKLSYKPIEPRFKLYKEAKQ